MRVLAVAMNTYREALRDKVLYVLLFFAGVTIVGSKALGWISIGQDEKIIMSISLAAVSLFGVLIAIFVGTNLIYKEIDKRTIYTILSQPMYRYEFILGKYLGLALLLAVVTLCMALMAALYLIVLGGTLSSSYIAAVALTFSQLLLVTALSVLLSSLTSPILGAIIVFSCYILGHATGILVDLPPQLQGTSAETVLTAIYYIVPNLEHFDVRAEAANGVPIAPAYLAWAVSYGAVYTLMLLVLAAFAFEEKDV